MAASKDRQIIPDIEWERLKPVIYEAYITRNLTLTKLMDYMKEEHSFHASKSLYETRFKKSDWNFKKNARGTEWGNLYHVLEARKAVGKASQVEVHGQTTKDLRLRRQARRHRSKIQGATQRLPEHITIKTPSPDLSPRAGHTSIANALTELNNRSDSLETVDFSSGDEMILRGSSYRNPVESDLAIADIYNIEFLAVGSSLGMKALADVVPTLASRFPSYTIRRFFIELEHQAQFPSLQIQSLDLNRYVYSQTFHNQMMFNILINIVNNQIVPIQLFQWSRRNETPNQWTAVAEAVRYLLSISTHMWNNFLDNIRIPDYRLAVERFLLHSAIETSNSSIVVAMLSRGVDPNELYFDNGAKSMVGYGHTNTSYKFRYEKTYALKRACCVGNLETIKILLQHGAIIHDHHQLDVGLYSPITHLMESTSHTEAPQELKDVLLLLCEKTPEPFPDILGWKVMSYSPNIIETAISLVPGTNLDILVGNNTLASIMETYENDVAVRAVGAILNRGWSRHQTTQDSWIVQLTKALEQSVVRGNREAIFMLIENGATPNSTCLVRAVERRDLKLVNYFLTLGIDANSSDYGNDCNPVDGYTNEVESGGSAVALSTAVNLRFFEAIDLFIQKGFLHNIGHRNRALVFTFRSACASGNEIVLDILLSEYQNQLSQVVLFCGLRNAIQHDQKVIISKLIGRIAQHPSFGAHVKPQDVVGAYSNPDLEDDGRYIPHQDVVGDITTFQKYVQACYGAESLENAIEIRNSDVFQRLFLAGTPLDIQCPLPVIEMTRFCNSHDKTVSKESILAVTLEKKDDYMVDLLLCRGRSFSMKRSEVNNQPVSLSALSACVLTKNIRLIEKILANGADASDDSALWNATILGRGDMIDVLLDAFTAQHPEGKKGFGMRVVRKAMQKGDWDIIERLKDNIDFETATSKGNLISSYDDKETLLGAAISQKDPRSLEFIEFLLRNGTDPNGLAVQHLYPISRETTALTYAISQRSLPKVELLVRAGANVSLYPSAPFSYVTPLMWASQMHQEEIARFLISNGAQANEASEPPVPPRPVELSGRGAMWITDPSEFCYGYTALQRAARYGNVAIARLLLEQNPPADVNAPAANIPLGRMAFEVATERGRLPMMAFLVQHGANLIDKGRKSEQYRRARKFAREQGNVTAFYFARRLLEAVRADKSLFDTFTSLSSR